MSSHDVTSGLELLNGNPVTGPVWRYRSPLRPFLFSASDRRAHGVRWVYDPSDVGDWGPDKVYTFADPLPDHVVKQWGLELVGS